MRIAFTSCFDAVRDSEQAAWKALAARAPDHIVLLGDSIYMDYGLGEHLGNGKPRTKSLAAFSALMHGCYVQQWEVENFRRAIGSGAGSPAVHAIWDDHDFAWNNARGGEFVEGDPDCVPAAYRRLARAHFEQYRQALVGKPATYPANPHPDGGVDHDLGGIEKFIELAAGVRLHLLDGRSFRGPVGKDSSLLGAGQRAALAESFLKEPGVNLVASGTTLKDWRHYSDYRWLRQQAEQHRIFVLSGDIHEADFRSGRMFEATASAMAQPPGITAWVGKQSEVFGLLDITPASIAVSLWHKGVAAQEHRIDLASWTSDM